MFFHFVLIFKFLKIKQQILQIFPSYIQRGKQLLNIKNVSK